MTTLTTSQARARLFQLVDAAVISRKPIQIKGRRSSAVLVASEDWDAIQETLYLLSIPDMRESLLDGMKTPISKCSKRVRSSALTAACPGAFPERIPYCGRPQ